MLIVPLSLQDLLSYARIPPAVNQIEVHPYFRNQYNIDFCHSKVRLACPVPSLLGSAAGLTTSTREHLPCLKVTYIAPSFGSTLEGPHPFPALSIHTVLWVASRNSLDGLKV